MKLNVQLPHTPCTGNCIDVPVLTIGDRMEIVEWACAVCGQKSVAFYDLDLVIEKDHYSDRLIRKITDDPCFRAFCVMTARFKRLPFVYQKKKYKGPSATQLLLDLYGLKTVGGQPDYVIQFLFHKRVPAPAAQKAMKKLLKKHGNTLLINEALSLPGYTGGLVGNPIEDPRERIYCERRYPLRNNFQALNEAMLNTLIERFVEMEAFEAAAILQRRITLLPPDFPKYSLFRDDTSEPIPKPPRVIRQEHYEERRRRLIEPYRKEIEMPEPEMPSGIFRPYPHPIDFVFFYYDFSSQFSGLFHKNEERYHVGDFEGYQIFKLQIWQARKVIKEYGHVHYLIRSKKDPGENIIVILLLVNGDTVVNAFYVLNTYKKISQWDSLSIRKDQDMETFELAVKHLLTRLLPTHFKLDWRPGVCDEE